MSKIVIEKDPPAQTPGTTPNPSSGPRRLPSALVPPASSSPFNPSSSDFLLPTTASAAKERVRRVASLTEFASDFDIIAELTDNRDRYTAHVGDNSPPLTIYNFPCNHAVDAIRAQFLPKSSRPGIHPTVACAICYGLEVLISNPDIQQFIALRQRFNTVPTRTSSNIIRIVGGWFNQFPIGMPTEVSAKVNIRIPLDIHAALGELSTELGMASYKVATLATLITLADQSPVNSDFRRSMQESVGIFFELVSIRIRGTNALLKIFNL